MSVLFHRPIARQPFRRSFLRHRCQADRGHHVYYTIEPGSLLCPARGQDHHCLETLQVHMRSRAQLDPSAHFPFERPIHGGAVGGGSHVAEPSLGGEEASSQLSRGLPRWWSQRGSAAAASRRCACSSYAPGRCSSVERRGGGGPRGAGHRVRRGRAHRGRVGGQQFQACGECHAAHEGAGGLLDQRAPTGQGLHSQRARDSSCAALCGPRGVRSGSRAGTSAPHGGHGGDGNLD
eukprot:704719-Pyramimonas_sp.AAC.1